MNSKLILVAMLSVFALSTYAHAEIYGATGDLDVGPTRDIINQNIVCKDASILFKMYENLPIDEARKDYIVEFFMPHLNGGRCVVTPASSVYVVGVRTAMIRSENRKPASKYVVVRIVINGGYWYVTPNALQQTGFEIIKAAQQENKNSGAPLVQ